eukprot:3133851-Rhodomonas_salina.1
MKQATTGQTQGTVCRWRQQLQQRPAALRHPSYDDGTTRLPRGLQRGRRRHSSEAHWQAGRESRQLGTGQGKGGWCCSARSESEAGGTAGSTYPWWGAQCSDPWPGKLSLLPVREAPAHGYCVGSEAFQRGSNERDELHVLLTMEGSIGQILAVDAVLELPRPARAPQCGFAFAREGMEG